MDVDGEAIQLHRIKGKYLAGYIRVSLEEQRESGISIPDQIARISEYAIRNRLAFRIFSDAGMSGKLPYSDARLVERMRAKQAEVYSSAFHSLLLQNPKYTAHKDGMESYLKDKVKQIKGGRVEMKKL